MSKNKKQIREQFRNDVFKRDHYHCVFCNETENLDAHHITDRHIMPNGGYVLENGITLCSEHHHMAEIYHNDGIGIDGFKPLELYKIIRSSYEIAYNKSLNLK